MRRSRIGLLLSTVLLVLVGSVPGVAAAQPTPAGPGDQHEDMLSGVLHGEGIVQTKQGPVRVAMQRGTATAVTDQALTVRSSDGFTRTWTLADNVKVYDKRKTLQPSALQAGSTVLVGGPIKTGGSAGPSPASSATYVAQIVLIHSASGQPSDQPSGSSS